jgi:hypothetical protein
MNRIHFVIIISTISSVLACSKDDAGQKVDCSKSTLAINLVNVEPSSGCSVSDGSVEVIASGGEEPYKFYINDVLMDGPVFTNLSSGIYTIRVRDNQKCERTLDNVPVLAEGFSFEADITGDTECLGGNGSITVHVDEGVPPFQYKIGNGSFAESNQFNALNSGTYDITIKDGNNCSVSLNLTVPKGLTATSFENDILPMIKTFCAKSGCHNGVDRTDLRLYTNAKKYAGEIKTLTRSREMPFEGSLTQDQIDLFTCWVDDGALDN